MTADPTTFVERLRHAVDAHDLDALAECFADDYRNETPVHPARGFVGCDQVRANWERIFTGVPDIRAEVLRTCVDGDTVWSEWEMRGTSQGGEPHIMRGVVIFGTADAQASWARFYLEPVDPGPGDITAAVGEFVADHGEART